MKNSYFFNGGSLFKGLIKDKSLTRSLQSIPVQNPVGGGGSPECHQRKDRRTVILVSNIGLGQTSYFT